MVDGQVIVKSGLLSENLSWFSHSCADLSTFLSLFYMDNPCGHGSMPI